MAEELKSKQTTENTLRDSLEAATKAESAILNSIADAKERLSTELEKLDHDNPSRDKLIGVIRDLAHKTDCSIEELRVQEPLKLMDGKAWSSSRSFLEDGWQTLYRADKLIRRNRKNVWWATWMFELRLKIVELKVYASIVHVELDSLPFLGLEHAPYGTVSIADRLADDAARMVRLDVFRLARVVESYGNCLLGLLHWRCRVSVEGEMLTASLSDNGNARSNSSQRPDESSAGTEPTVRISPQIHLLLQESHALRDRQIAMERQLQQHRTALCERFELRLSMQKLRKTKDLSTETRDHQSDRQKSSEDRDDRIEESTELDRSVQEYVRNTLDRTAKILRLASVAEPRITP